MTSEIESEAGRSGGLVELRSEPANSLGHSATIPSAVIEQFCADLQHPLESTLKKFSEELYAIVLGDVQFYLGENATFNIGSKFDAQQREVVTAFKALAAVESSTSLTEAHANAYAARKGYWSEERAAEYRAQAIETRRAETDTGSVVDESAVAKPCAQGDPA